jgi:hypothetical protein
MPERIYEDYLYYVLKKKDEELYLDEMGYDTECLAAACAFDTSEAIQNDKSQLDDPDEWEIRKMKITYELLEGEGGE